MITTDRGRPWPGGYHETRAGTIQGPCLGRHGPCIPCDLGPGMHEGSGLKRVRGEVLGKGQRRGEECSVMTQATQAALSWQHVGGDEARPSPVRVGRVARDPSAPSRSILGLGRAASAQRSSAAACKTCSEVPEEAQAAARRAGPVRVGLWVHTGLARLLCALTSSRARCNRPLRCGGPVGKRTTCAALKHPVQRRFRGAAEQVGSSARSPGRSSVPGV